MQAPRSIGFIAPRAAWLFGHAAGARARAGAALLLVLAATLLSAAALWNVRAHAEAQARTAALPAAALPAAAPASAATPALNAAERARINRVVRRLNTPWSAIFEALENQATPQVAVLGVETDAERGAVRVQTEGRSLDELLVHAERVQATAPFVRTRLLRVEPPDAAASAAELTRLNFDLVLAP